MGNTVKVIIGINDLTTTNPVLATEWHPNKNGDKKPEQYTAGSNVSVWWKCKNSHEWIARIAKRALRGDGCPYCSCKKVLSGFNDLATTNASIAEEWDYSMNNGHTPQEYSKGSHESVWWKCPKGHPSYKARIANRVYKGDGCPYCANRRILRGYNDLSSVNPNLAKQWDYEKNYPVSPEDVFPRENKNYWWICPLCGESYQASLANRSAGKAHSKCCKKGTSFPEQAIFYYVKKLFPDTVSRDTSFGFELDIFIPSIMTAVEYDGAQYHNSEKAIKNDNKKDALCSEVGIKLFRFRDPSLPDTNSAIRISCIDKREYIGDGIIELLKLISLNSSDSVNLRRDYYSILDCSLLDQHSKSIINTHPDIASEWHTTKNSPLTPEKVTSGMGIMLWWHCNACGADYSMRMYSRKAGQGCPTCGKKRRGENRSYTASKKNSFANKFPELVKEIAQEENNNLDVTKLSAGSPRKIFWKCSNCGFVWSTSVAHRAQGSGCPRCGRVRTREAAKRKVINLDTGEVFSSLSQAAESCNGDKRNIFCCCSGVTKTAYGFKWSYADSKHRRSNKGMLVYNVDTKEVFSTIQEASDKYACNRSSIASALNGKSKTSMGFHWEYIKKGE